MEVDSAKCYAWTASIHWWLPMSLSSQRSGKHREMGEEKLRESKRMKGTRRTWPNKSTKQESQKPKQQSQEAYMGLDQFFCVYIRVVGYLFLWTPNLGRRWILMLLSALLLLLDQSSLNMKLLLCLIVFFFIFALFDKLLLEAHSFLRMKQKESGSGRKDHGRGHRKSRERRNCGSDVLHERTIYSQL